MTQCFVHLQPSLAQNFDLLDLPLSPNGFQRINFAQPLPALGTSFSAILFELGHDQPLQPVTDLSPAIHRQISGFAARHRRQPREIQLFGILDLMSPFGSRKAVETFVRATQSSQLPIVLHLGIWDPTPRDLERGLHEMQTLCHNRIAMGSIFPVTQARYDKQATKKYIDTIFSPNPPQSSLNDVRLPLDHPHFFHPSRSLDQSICVIANHGLHDLTSLERVLADEFGIALVPLETTQHPNPTVEYGLTNKKHIVSITDSKPAQTAYLGSNIVDPYFESYYIPSSEELLELLLSPHFGSQDSPWLTTVIVSQLNSGREVDLLKHYFRKLAQDQGQSDVYFIQPHNLAHQVYATNT